MSPTVDPRIARTRQVVLAAAMEELVDVGFERVSIDAIAERSGVARSTIYRNWPDRPTLLAEAFRQLYATGPADLPPADSLAEDLSNLARLLVDQLGSEEWRRTVPSLISAAVHDQPMRELLTTFVEGRAREAEAILVRAERRGEIADPRDFDGVLERFVAPFFLRRLLSLRPLDEAFIAAQVASALDQLGPVRSTSG